MSAAAYHPPWSHLLHPVTCEHPACTSPSTHARGGFRLCFDHWLCAVQWEQPRHEEVSA